MKYITQGLIALLLGIGVAALVNAQSVVGPPAPGPRFWMSDYTLIGGSDSYPVFILHDNKYREVCFLVVGHPTGGLVMTPRQC